MKIRLVAATALVGALGGFAALTAPANAASVCVHASVTVATTTQTVDKCVP